LPSSTRKGRSRTHREHEKRTRGGKVRWYARYRDPAGVQRTRTFDRKVDAERCLTSVESTKMAGAYVDPPAGAITVREFYDSWSTRQVWAAGTEKAMSLAIRSCTFATVRLHDVRPSHVEHWAKAMSTAGLQQRTIRTRVNNIRAVLRAAVRDRRIATDPSESVRLPRGRARAAAMDVPTVEVVGRLMAAATVEFVRSSRCARSPVCASARPPPSRSPTSTSCAAP
jgi:hypothetical protein